MPSLDDLLADRRPPAHGGRDLELVTFVGRLGVVAIGHVMAALGVGQAAAYRRVGACIERGLLERLAILRGEPTLLRATRAGLRQAGLGLEPAAISPGLVDHWLRCASTALELAARFGPERVISERELRQAERLEGRPIASAALGRLPSGHPRLHRPDLVLLGGSGPVAIEVELTPKAPRRLLQIVRAWRGAECVSEVHYHCSPGPTRRGLEAAVAKTYAGEKVRLFEVVSR